MQWTSWALGEVRNPSMTTDDLEFSSRQQWRLCNHIPLAVALEETALLSNPNVACAV